MSKNKPAGISLCMIVKNEERFLADALRSVAGVVDEICVVDTGSTDATMTIAREHGALVREVAWRDDFGWARNQALAMATRRWIIVLDADERLSPASANEVRAIGQTPAGLCGKWIACRNLSDEIKGSGAMTNALVRVFPNDERIRYRNAIHEFVALDGGESGLPSEASTIEIVHHGYLAEVVRDRGKAERNLRLSRAAAAHDPGDAFHQYNLGMSLVLAGERDEAIAALERTRELTLATPRGFRAHALVVLADLLADHRGEIDRAQAIVAEAIACAPNLSSGHFAQGKLCARSGRLYEAREAFGRAIAAGAHDGEQFVVDGEIAIWKAHSEIGATLMREQRWSDALRWFELASAARPAAAPLVVNRAKCHEALGDSAAAAALYRAAFELFADEPAAIEYVNFLLRAGHPGEALHAVEAALPVLSEGYRRVFLGTAAAIELRAGRAEAARGLAGRALALGDPAEAQATLRALAVQLGEPGLATLVPRVPDARASGLRIAYSVVR